jgi:hypothetical protein
MEHTMSFFRVYKYPLEVQDGAQNPNIPHGAEILHVAMQGQQICIWALVDTRQQASNRLFVVYGTGHPITTVGSYIGTAHDRQFVWHVFEAL